MGRHAYTIQRGKRSQQVLVFAARAGAAGEGVTGLRHDADGARAAWVRAGEAARELRLVAGRAGEWVAGGFAEVDRDLMPGVYQLGLPDELVAPGSPRALLMLQFSGALIDPIEIDLVGFDPQDPVRLGMVALGPEARVQALQGAFPLLARKEIEERMARLSAEAPEPRER